MARAGRGGAGVLLRARRASAVVRACRAAGGFICCVRCGGTRGAERKSRGNHFSNLSGLINAITDVHRRIEISDATCASPCFRGALVRQSVRHHSRCVLAEQDCTSRPRQTADTGQYLTKGSSKAHPTSFLWRPHKAHAQCYHSAQVLQPLTPGGRLAVRSAVLYLPRVCSKQCQ